MKSFDYVIKDSIGIHARPAGLLVKEAKQFESDCTLAVGEKSASLKKLISVIGLGVKHGDRIMVTVKGVDEDAAIEAIKNLMTENL